MATEPPMQWDVHRVQSSGQSAVASAAALPPPPLNPSGYGINIVDAPLSGAWHVLWGPTGTPWGRAEGCNM